MEDQQDLDRTISKDAYAESRAENLRLEVRSPSSAQPSLQLHLSEWACMRSDEPFSQASPFR